MNKKVIIIIGSVLSIFVILLIVIPQIFKDEIKDEILRNVNRNADLEISIDDYDLSLISNFPKFTFYFEGMRIYDANKNELISIEEVSAVIDSKDLIVNRSISLNTISIIKPIINYTLTNDSLATTQEKPNQIKSEQELVMETSEPITEEKLKNQKNTISLNISNYKIVEAYINIKDENNNEFIKIVNLNHSGYGTFQDDILSLNTHSSIDSISVSQGKSSLLKNAHLKGELDLDLDFKNKIYTLKDNSLNINKIELNWVGVIKEIGNDINIDLRFDTPHTDFKDLLVMIPDDYKKDFENIKTKGNFKIEGNILGIYNDETMPEFNLKSSITNAYIKYPDLPESVDDINLTMNINKPQGNDFDKVTIDIPNASVKIADNKIDASMSAYNLVTDPHLQAKISANLDLSKLRNAIPIEKDDNINGKIFADIFLKGKMSDLENERYSKFDAKGDIRLTNFSFTTKSFNNKILISDANIVISPKSLQLKTFDFKIGKSDIKAKGTINKYLEYILEDKQLTGTLDIKSNYFYASDFTPVDEETTTAESKTSNKSVNKESEVTEKKDEKFAMDVIEIPANINFENNININHFVYGDIKADNLKGKLGIRNENAYMKNIRMNTLDGQVILNGNYSSQTKKSPKTDFDLSLKNIDIQQLAKTFDFVNKIAPIIENTTGRINSKLDFKTTLDNTMNPVYETMYSKGNIKTSNVSLQNSDFIKDLGSILNIDELKKDPKIEDINLSYSIKKGILTVAPFNLNIADIKTEFKGSSNIGKETIDMDASIIFPRKYLGKETNDIIDNAVNLANTFGMDVKVGETIDVNAKIRGDIAKPKYALTYGPGKAETPEQYLKQQADKIIDDAKKDSGKELEKKANDLLKGLFK
jgi:hypothetical protein